MNEEFNLSDKAGFVGIDETFVYDLSIGDVYSEKDVKEFIKRLKEEMPNQDLTEWKEQQKLIDKLAGDKLI